MTTDVARDTAWTEWRSRGQYQPGAREAFNAAWEWSAQVERERIAAAIEARATDVYPLDIFLKPSRSDYAEINALLKRERGHQLDGVASDVMRRAHAGIAAEMREYGAEFVDRYTHDAA